MLFCLSNANPRGHINLQFPDPLDPITLGSAVFSLRNTFSLWLEYSETTTSPAVVTVKPTGWHKH